MIIKLIYWLLAKVNLSKSVGQIVNLSIYDTHKSFKWGKLTICPASR